jgi:hypothetical protein
MNARDQLRNLCEMTHHEWKEEYYGYRCETCGEFILYGCEPWMPLDEPPTVSDDEWDYFPFYDPYEDE